MLLWIVSIGIGILYGIREEDNEKHQKYKEENLRSIIELQSKQIDELIDYINDLKSKED